jgi:hypothetical protein
MENVRRVQCVESHAELRHDGRHLHDGERPGAGDMLEQVQTFDEIHHDVRADVER